MDEPYMYRTRFRFRLEKMLDIVEKEKTIIVDGHEITISPQLPDVNISDSNWLVMNATGFSDKARAENFGEKLKLACETLSASMRLGLDSGKDLPTSGYGSLVKEKVKETSGIVLRDNVHGLDIFEDSPNIRIGHISGIGVVRSSGKAFVDEINNFYNEVESASAITKDIVLLLNYALLRPDPVARIVFAFSAVEMLGQDEKWSENQEKLIKIIADLVFTQNVGSEEEKIEVADAIKKGLHRLSLRQGVFRLFEILGLSDLKKRWDLLYKERSTLVHGVAPRPGVDYSDFSHRSLSLCGHVLLTVVAQEVPSANSFIAKYYPI